ncbi:MAG: ribulose-phosphate 3-epimerase [Chitinivibrionales bacterium]|nr:ribulose-phosphate 3-epimerase [Chitinivibrionales bacterium]
MNNKKIYICPSILSADFRKLEQEVKDVEQAGADRIHCDVMDGHFVPNLTFGPMVIEAVKKCVSIPLDVHLMISNPEKYIDNYCNAGADILTVHAEVCKEGLPEVLAAIESKGVKRGVTVNPDKGIDLFLPLLEQIDQVLIMTVYAGFGGQKFISEMLPKIRSVRDTALEREHPIDIQVDGGINDETARECAAEGANVFVAGNYIFGADNYGRKIDALRQGASTGNAR